MNTDIYKSNNDKGYTTFEILDEKEAEEIRIPIDTGEYTTLPHGTLYVPSCAHSYSLGVQYIRDWFVDKFDPNFFKTVFVNGRHIMSDYMNYSKVSLIYREKPAVAITPMPNMEFDRNMQDAYMGGEDLLLRKYNHQQGFFRDFENNIFLGLNVREQQINFNIKCRVETRAEQLDLYRKMEMACRVGFTQYEFVECDFHLPTNIMYNIANNAGFRIIEEKDADGRVIDEKIENIAMFLEYLNSKSDMPITYKMRGMSGKHEFFLRVKRTYCHIDTTEKLSYDDGIREGHLDNDFHVELNCVLNMWVPGFYAYKSAQPVVKYITTTDTATIGLWYCKVLDIPKQNKDGWNLYIQTDYELDKSEKENNMFNIDMTDLFADDFKLVIKDELSKLNSPSKFIDITVFNIISTATCSINWDDMNLVVENCMSSKIVFAIYIDMAYYNNRLLELKR